MRKRLISFTLGALLLALCSITEAQQPKKVARIVILSPGPWRSVDLEVFRQGLRDAGYIEGQNIAIEFRSAEGKLERFPELATEVVRLNPDIIVTSSTSAARAANRRQARFPLSQLEREIWSGAALSLALLIPEGISRDPLIHPRS